MTKTSLDKSQYRVKIFHFDRNEQITVWKDRHDQIVKEISTYMNNKSVDLTGHTIEDVFRINWITDDYDGYAILTTSGLNDKYELIGLAYTQNIDILPNYNSTFIHFIGILEEYRGLGIGTEALSLIVEDIKKRYSDCIDIQLGVLTNDEAAYRFYKKSGFSDIYRYVRLSCK